MTKARDSLLVILPISLFCVACRPQPSTPVVTEPGPAAAQPSPTASPWDTTYQLDSLQFTLTQGRASLPAAPGSSATIDISMTGDALHADLDDDDHDDLVILLRVERGGSGTFHYVAAALNDAGTYRGANLVVLGDRIAPEDLSTRRGVIQVSYLDRGDNEPMSSPPTHERHAYTLLVDDRLQPIVKLEEDEELYDATVTIGHEVRVVRPCTVSAEAWISGRSPALREIIASYHSREGADPYTPSLMVLTGRLTNERDRSEFGSKYETTFVATRLVRRLALQAC